MVGWALKINSIYLTIYRLIYLSIYLPMLKPSTQICAHVKDPIYPAGHGEEKSLGTQRRAMATRFPPGEGGGRGKQPNFPCLAFGQGRYR